MVLGINLGDVIGQILSRKMFYAVLLWIFVTYVAGLGSLTYSYLESVTSLVPSQLVYAFSILVDIFIFWLIVYLVFMVYSAAKWIHGRVT